MLDFILFIQFLYIPYSRCIRSAEFSLRVVWLLEAYSSDAHLTSKKKSDGKTFFTLVSRTGHWPHVVVTGTKLKTLILSDKLRPKELMPRYLENRPRPLTLQPSPSKKAHQRSQSDASAVLLAPAKSLGMYHKLLLNITSFLKCVSPFFTLEVIC